MQYDIITAQTVEALKEEVSKQLAKGWQPVGGADSVSMTGQPTNFIQAMGKLERKSK